MKKILCVDDNDDILKLYIEIFGVRGYDTLVATNDKDALSAMVAERPPVVLMDMVIGYGSLDGLDTARQIKKLYPETKILLISGHLLDYERYSHEEKCLFAGMIAKPAKADELLRIVGEMFDE